MANSSESNGSQTCTIGTEHTLAAPSTEGNRQLKLDLINLASQDILEVRVYEKVDGTNLRVASVYAFQGAQPTDGMIANSIISSTHDGCEFRIRQTHGTGRVIPWRVLKLG
jgi:hypothetical protein